MSEMLTNQAAGRLCREVQGACLTAARTQHPVDVERATRLTRDTIGVRDIWTEVDAPAHQILSSVESYVSQFCFSLAADVVGRAAQIFEARCATRGGRAAA